MGLLSSLNPFKSTQPTTTTTQAAPADAPAAPAPASTPSAPEAPAPTEAAPAPTGESKAGALAAHVNSVGANFFKAKLENQISARTPRTAEPEKNTLDGEVRGRDPVQAGANVYEKNGNTKYDLNDPAAAKQLIVNSPQLDNSEKTKNDPVRCGGAAMLNGMLLDGKPSANASAIEATAKQSGVAITGDEQAALNAMKKGEMTPNQAATTQELLLKMGKAGGEKIGKDDTRFTEAGLTPPGMAELGVKLRKNGAFANSEGVTFHQSATTPATDPETRHWTVSVKNKGGDVTTANSFPGSSGEGTVGTAPNTSNLRNADGTQNSNYRADVAIENRADGQVRYEVNSRTLTNGQPDGAIERQWKTVGAKESPGFPDFVREFANRETGEKLK